MDPLGHRKKAVERIWNPADQSHGPGGQAAWGSNQSLTLTDHDAEIARHTGRISLVGVDLPLRLIDEIMLWPWLATGYELPR